MNKIIWLPTIAIVTLIAACSYGPDSPKGFSLPQGNEAMGEKVFIKYECLSCHSLTDYETDAVIMESISREFDEPIKLGGTTSTVKTYGQLVTSVINPSHKLAHRSRFYKESLVNEDGTSKMWVFNDVMTVQELIDLVAFLQPKYKVKPITYTHYGQYRML
jgi:sulfur-oxidizing protein SoxX